MLFEKKIFQVCYLYVFLCKNSSPPQLWPNPFPGDYDLDNHESTLPEGASKPVKAFYVLLVLKKSILKVFLYLLFKSSTIHCSHTLTPRDHNLNKRKSTIPEDSFTKVSAFLVNCFLSRKCKKLTGGRTDRQKLSK